MNYLETSSDEKDSGIPGACPTWEKAHFVSHLGDGATGRSIGDLRGTREGTDGGEGMARGREKEEGGRRPRCGCRVV